MQHRLPLQAPLFDVLRQLMGPLLVLGDAFARHHPVALALLKLAGDCVEAHVSFLEVPSEYKLPATLLRHRLLTTCWTF